MTDKFESLPEVGLAIANVHSRLNWMTAVYAVTNTVIAVVGAWGLMTLVSVSNDVANIKGQLTGIGDQLASIKSTVEGIRADQPRLEKRSALDTKDGVAEPVMQSALGKWH